MNVRIEACYLSASRSNKHTEVELRIEAQFAQTNLVHIKNIIDREIVALKHEQEGKRHA